MISPARLCVTALLAAMTSAAFAAQDGYLDPTFGKDGRQTIAFDLGSFEYDLAFEVAVAADGKLYVVGDVVSPTGNWGVGLARLKANGQPDATFAKRWYLPDGLKDSYAYGAVLQPDGKLIVVGEGVGDISRPLVCRFLASGLPDTGFATEVNLLQPGCRLIEYGDSSGYASSVAVHADGRIAVAGAAKLGGMTRAQVSRLDAHGNPDESIGPGGTRILFAQAPYELELTDLAVTPEGDLVAVTSGNVHGNGNVDWLVMRLRGEDMALDTDFLGTGSKTIGLNAEPNGDDIVAAVAVQRNGDIVVAGYAINGNNEACPAVAMLTSTGGVIDSFDADGRYVDTFCLDGSVTDMVTQSDGRIVLGGHDGDHMYATRLEPQGGRDTSFGANGVYYVNFQPFHGVPSKDYAYAIASHAGRLVLAGKSSTADKYDMAVVRLDNDLIYVDDME